MNKHILNFFLKRILIKIFLILVCIVLLILINSYFLKNLEKIIQNRNNILAEQNYREKILKSNQQFLNKINAIEKKFNFNLREFYEKAVLNRLDENQLRDKIIEFASSSNVRLDFPEKEKIKNIIYFNLYSWDDVVKFSNYLREKNINAYINSIKLKNFNKDKIFELEIKVF
jgi:hypothetical protein